MTPIHPDITPKQLAFFENIKRVLRARPKQVTRFDMNVAIADYTHAARSPQNQECGFTACALGTAAFDPWFNAQGLVIEDGTLLFNGSYLFDYPEEFLHYFELSDPVFESLFGGSYSLSSGGYTTEAEVIREIDHYLTHGRVSDYAHAYLD